MANKLKKDKPVIKKPVETKIAPMEDVAAKDQPAPDASEESPSEETVFNAETTGVLRDADAGKNLIHYASLDEMFKDLGSPRPRTIIKSRSSSGSTT